MLKSESLHETSHNVEVSDAFSYQSLRCMDMADYGLRDVLVSRREILGDLHVDTLQTMHCLARTRHIKGYAEMSKNSWTDAESLYREALEGRTQLLGVEHLDTCGTTRQFDALMGELDRKIESLRKDIETLKVELGERNKTTIMATSSLSDTLYHRHKGVTPEAKELWKKVVSIALQEYGPEDKLVKELTHPLLVERFHDKDSDDGSFLPGVLGNIQYKGNAPFFTETI